MMTLFMRHWSFVLLFGVLLWVPTVLHASLGMFPATSNGFGETEIKHSFVITMKPCDPICIDGSVVLSCPDTIENVLSYRWINKGTGAVVGESKSITVSPKNTTEYELRVTFIRKSDERIKNWDFEKGNVDFTSQHSYVGYTGGTALWNEDYMR